MQLREVRPALSAFPELPVAQTGRVVVTVTLGARRQRVRVLAAGDWLRVEGRILPLDTVEGGPLVRDLAGRLLEANGAGEFVGLTRDEDNFLVARHDIPPDAGVGELVDAIWRVARVADRWELLWTGKDAE